MMIECANFKESSFSYQDIDNPKLFKHAKNKLPLSGILKQNALGTYYYLKVHDDFIFELLPLINATNLSAPDYFQPACNIGAHISVIYPEEMPLEKIKIDELEQSFSFEIMRLLKAFVFNKTVLLLSISSPSL